MPGASESAGETKRDLTKWWRNFSKRREEEKGLSSPPGIFGVPLQVSIRYANVAISLFDENGRSFIYGYVPIVVAKCGVFLKEKATEVEGIFRLAGAERRIKELVNSFNSPDKYGKSLDWTGYSVHDASNVLRRYLNQLPEPIIPLESYEGFRRPLQAYQAQIEGRANSQAPPAHDFDVDNAILTYQQLITELPPLNRQLLLYLLDLLAVFASKSDINRMPSSNLSSIFQPGILSHPIHDMVPEAYRLSQEVLIFLIEHQDHFLVGMQGTAADEKTIQEVQSGSPSPAKPTSGSTTPKGRTQQLLGRSASVASSSNVSARRFGSIRRNMSVSSRGSRQSGLSPSPAPGTPPSGLAISSKSGGIQRSNTVPSQHSLSPALPNERFSRENSREGSTVRDIGTPTVISPVPSDPTSPAETVANDLRQGIMFAPNAAPPQQNSPHLTPIPAGRSPSRSRQSSWNESMQLEMPPPLSGKNSPATTPNRERTLSSLFKQSPVTDAEKGDGRKPNKLVKKRVPQAIISPRSSSHSLGGLSLPASPAHGTFSLSRRGSQQPAEVSSASDPKTNNNFAASQDNLAIRPRLPDLPSTDQTITTTLGQLQELGQGQRSHQTSPNGSVDHGYSSFETADEELEAFEDREPKKEKRRWRLSSPKKEQPNLGTGGSSANLASPFTPAYRQERSTSTVGSVGRSAMSTTDDSYRSGMSGKAPSQEDPDERVGNTATPSAALATSPISAGPERERRGLAGWFKGKLGNRDRSDSKERERARSPRAKSPMAAYRGDLAASRQSLKAMLGGAEPTRSGNRSVEALGAVPTAGNAGATEQVQSHGHQQMLSSGQSQSQPQSQLQPPTQAQTQVQAAQVQAQGQGQVQAQEQGQSQGQGQVQSPIRQ